MTVLELIDYLKTQRQDAIVRIPDVNDDSKVGMRELNPHLIYLLYKDGNKSKAFLDLGDC